MECAGYGVCSRNAVLKLVCKLKPLKDCYSKDSGRLRLWRSAAPSLLKASSLFSYNNGMTAMMM